MKVSTILALAGAAAINAQTINTPNSGDLECARTCETNMLNSGLDGCGPDVQCLCAKKDFYYGVRDCSAQACAGPDIEGAKQAMAWFEKQCQLAGVTPPPVDDVPTAVASGTGGAAGSPVVTQVVTTITSGGSVITSTFQSTISGTGAGAGGSAGATPTSPSVSATPLSTGSFTTIFTNSAGSATSTSIGETTVSGINGTPVAGAGTSSVTQPLVSTAVSGSSTFVTTTGSTVVPADSTSTATDASGNASSSSSSGLGAQATAAPLAGFIAAVGLAAAFL